MHVDSSYTKCFLKGTSHHLGLHLVVASQVSLGWSPVMVSQLGGWSLYHKLVGHG